MCELDTRVREILLRDYENKVNQHIGAVITMILSFSAFREKNYFFEMLFNDKIYVTRLLFWEILFILIFLVLRLNYWVIRLNIIIGTRLDVNKDGKPIIGLYHGEVTNKLNEYAKDTYLNNPLLFARRKLAYGCRKSIPMLMALPSLAWIISYLRSGKLFLQFNIISWSFLVTFLSGIYLWSKDFQTE